MRMILALCLMAVTMACSDHGSGHVKRQAAKRWVVWTADETLKLGSAGSYSVAVVPNYKRTAYLELDVPCEDTSSRVVVSIEFPEGRLAVEPHGLLEKLEFGLENPETTNARPYLVLRSSRAARAEVIWKSSVYDRSRNLSLTMRCNEREHVRHNKKSKHRHQ